jgi:hypothetical protein
MQVAADVQHRMVINYELRRFGPKGLWPSWATYGIWWMCWENLREPKHNRWYPIRGSIWTPPEYIPEHRCPHFYLRGGGAQKLQPFLSAGKRTARTRTTAIVVTDSLIVVWCWQDCENRIFASVYLSVRPSAGTMRLPLCTFFYGIWYFSIFHKSVRKIQVSLKFDKNDGHFTWRCTYICDNTSLNFS